MTASKVSFKDLLEAKRLKVLAFLGKALAAKLARPSMMVVEDREDSVNNLEPSARV